MRVWSTLLTPRGSSLGRWQVSRIGDTCHHYCHTSNGHVKTKQRNWKITFQVSLSIYPKNALYRASLSLTSSSEKRAADDRLWRRRLHLAVVQPPKTLPYLNQAFWVRIQAWISKKNRLFRSWTPNVTLNLNQNKNDSSLKQKRARASHAWRSNYGSNARRRRWEER